MKNTSWKRALLLMLTTLAWSCGSDEATPGVATAGAVAGTTATPPAAPAESGASTTPGAGATIPTTTPTRPSGAAGASTPTTSGAAGSGAAAVGGAAASSATTPTAGGGAAPTGAGGSAAPAGNPTAMAGAGAPPASSAGKLPRVMTTDGMGPFTSVEKVMNTPPGGWLIYPTDIGRDGIKHPLFVFGPGGGTTPSTYEGQGHWDRYGSYGFVIYALPQSTGDGAAMKAGLDWLIEQNDDMSSPLYQKLDTTKICAAGHSMGSITTFDFMPDDRVTTTIHISGGSFDGNGSMNLRSDTMFLCGPSGAADMATPQCDVDFENSMVPTFYTKVEGSDHISSGRMGWDSLIAWMLWHLADQEDQWKKEFLEPTGKFQTGKYVSQTKNWQ